ncbi:hypothetical protein NA56DRAFT_244853 [Hyaloscypha hepaticicola]|uniref:Uncharacterized protein n=1 Tax=Hyaloscypha hepaticicola TaxID=2082293 RepID=A0A2J6PWU6_9HELO|nr:hypothetical protein NA56DRAFT_244853 [Hyaloscypha hepaticicola]
MKHCVRILEVSSSILFSVASLRASRARLKAKSAARTTENDEWDADDVEEWNPADEARQAKRLEPWRSSQEQRLGEGNQKVTDSPSEFRPYQNPRQKQQQPQGDPRLRSEESVN